MDAGAYFSESYLGAHDKFVSACRALRLLPQSYWASSGHGDTDPPLVDSVRLGDPSARHILVVCGGDRQADALCCSAIEIGWLNEFAKASLPRDTAILLVHHGAAPPTGGEAPPRGGPPPVWEDDLLAKVEKRYAEYARQKGVDSLGAPLDTPEVQGIPGYPGTLLDALAKWLGSAAAGRVAFVEIRVGLGAYGVAEITPCHPPETAAARRVRSWFGLAEPAYLPVPPQHWSSSPDLIGVNGYDPERAKALLATLEQNLKRFEETHGKIPAPDPQGKGEIGFQTATEGAPTPAPDGS